MTSSRTRRLVAGTAIAAALGLGGLGVAAFNPLGVAGAEEASSSDPTEPAAPSTEPGAPAPSGDRRQLVDDVLDALTEEGVIDQEQNDTISERIEDAIEEWRDANPPGERPGGPGGPGGPGHGGPGGMGLWGAWEAAAEIIGVEPEALRDGLRDGQSVAEIAAAAGVERQAVIDAIVAEAEEHIASAVESGWLGEEGAQRLRDRLPEMADNLVDLKRPTR